MRISGQQYSILRDLFYHGPGKSIRALEPAFGPSITMHYKRMDRLARKGLIRYRKQGRNKIVTLTAAGIEAIRDSVNWLWRFDPDEPECRQAGKVQ